ncbi:uncharacterized protein LOC122509086 [Leptopilina heterotoma]|uniref:uncharacterized protein LOC122509086 n=1 Tax=Leptopilina heterotoma TaxID=63436 RepID=UPI001CA854C1|nr:uncharacterized protein LOC122509086 [Leptopilina heterotoma]
MMEGINRLEISVSQANQSLSLLQSDFLEYGRRLNTVKCIVSDIESSVTLTSERVDDMEIKIRELESSLPRDIETADSLLGTHQPKTSENNVWLSGDRFSNSFNMQKVKETTSPHRSLVFTTDKTVRQQQEYRDVKTILNDRIKAGETNLKIRFYKGIPKIISV